MDTENCKIITDGLRLRQIINNLISNAIKFTDKGFIRFGYEIENHDFVTFFVEDSGIGIDPSMFDLIFMPFRQVEEGDARRFGGTGLGLPISLGLVKMLQGKMWLESTKGKGTTFYFNIPYKAFIEKQAPQKATKQEETEPAWGDKRILIVEDDNMNYEFLKAILKPTSIIIERALDGMQAVSMCQRGGFNLVLMDIRIPKLDGLKATRQIRDAGLTLPIIAQTAYAMANDKDKCLAAGCDDYLSKPINKNLLIEILSKYISD